MGSAAFLNEAISQLAEAYLDKKQEELGEQIAFDKRTAELQRVKMFIADRNVYGVDLNPIAVELAEVSLWLNTIYKGAHVPWFGTQLACGNSLIGARRQVYNALKLKKGTWYNEEPEKVPEEWVTDRYSHETKKQYKRKRSGGSYIYHFLLGDPGMANYTDKVIKELEPDNIKLIKQWQKEFCSKYSDEDIEILNKLSDIVDDLWMRTINARQKVEIRTEDSLSVYGHDEGAYEEHLTIREKDTIYQNIYKSIGGENASPYARLKAAMDYWCALWFWPIDKADMLPTRQEFFMELSLILEGGISATVKKNQAIGQLEIQYDEHGQFKGFGTQGSELANEVQAQINGLGVVNLEQIRNLYPRLQITDDIAKQQRFMHWELEFADLFYERGGFDLVIGNPPWILLLWNEENVLSEDFPMMEIRKQSAAEIASERSKLITDDNIRKAYMQAYADMAGMQNYYSAVQNYKILSGMKTNLFKCFLPQAWMIGNKDAVSAFVHPDGVYDDPKGGTLRQVLYRKLRMHFQFTNELKLFAEVDHHMGYSLNVYDNHETEVFDSISNLFTPSTIDECYSEDVPDQVPGIKDENGWCIKGHPSRIIRVTKDELLLFAKLFDDSDKWEEGRLPVIHTTEFVEILKRFAKYPKTISSISEKELAYAVMFFEAADSKKGIIKRDVHFPSDPYDCIISGPHIGVGNPRFKTSRAICKLNSDYDSLDLLYIDDDYVARCNYGIACGYENFTKNIIDTPWGEKYHETYRIGMRKMLNLSGERTLVAAIIPPKVSHIDGIYSMTFKNGISVMAGSMASIVFDFYLKTTGKSNGCYNVFSAFPVFDGSIYADDIAVRALMLNAVTSQYKTLWEKEYSENFKCCKWGKQDRRLSDEKYVKLSPIWERDFSLRTDYERREALIEIDVLVAMALGLTYEQLITAYRIQFPVLQSYEADTWYDSTGKIVFTNNRSLTNVGFSRKEWEEITTKMTGVFPHSIIDDTMPGGPVERTIEYVAPFDRCDREKDYEEVWANFEERFKK